MAILLLLIIYVIFISLGLPDSLIGSSWPAVTESLKIDPNMQGVLTSLVSICTVISAFFTVKLVKYLKTPGVITLSIALTAGGLISFCYAPNFLIMCLAAIPLGLGAGAIDTTLNNYVAIHYKAIHLNWLHAFWGIGASTSPFVVSIFLTDINGWRDAALCLGIVQSIIFIISLLSFPIYKRAELSFKRKENNDNEETKEDDSIKLGFFKSFTIKGVMFAIMAFFSYVAIEQLTGYWFSSMAAFDLGVEKDVAASWTSLFYVGIVVGRIISGIVSLKVSDKNLIRGSEILLVVGIVLMTFIFNVNIMPIAIFIVGLACGPIYPAIIHSTPTRFTNQLSASVMAIQVGCAYVANFTISPLFGVVASASTFLTLPYVLLFFLILMALGNEIVLIKTKDKTKLLKEFTE